MHFCTSKRFYGLKIDVTVTDSLQVETEGVSLGLKLLVYEALRY